MSKRASKRRRKYYFDDDGDGSFSSPRRKDHVVRIDSPQSPSSSTPKTHKKKIKGYHSNSEQISLIYKEIFESE